MKYTTVANRKGIRVECDVENKRAAKQNKNRCDLSFDNQCGCDGAATEHVGTSHDVCENGCSIAKMKHLTLANQKRNRGDVEYRRTSA